MNRFFLVPALGLAALALSTPAHARQSGLWTDAVRIGYADERQPYFEARRGAYDNGFREGVKRGEQDGRRRARAYYENDKTWQRADRGYNRSYGEIERYRQQFRAGYAAGYQDSYARYGQVGGYGNGRAVPRQDPYRYPGGYGSPNQNRYPGGVYGSQGPYNSGRYGSSPAYGNGVNDGVEKGREDARKRRSYDPLRHEWYRDGDRHYRSQYGSRQQYENIYRDGFKEGYDRGFRDLGYIR